ncbi:hypothetical protein RR11_1331 [Ruegeria sp. R11]|nr:hypothetical protein RR11_1331 [Ruegeria sp. R11]
MSRVRTMARDRASSGRDVASDWRNLFAEFDVSALQSFANHFG